MAFLKEVGKLRDLGVNVDGQFSSLIARKSFCPYHRMIELAAESAPGRKKIGTTSRGIGPAYEDKIARNGLRVIDLLNPASSKHTSRTPAAKRTPSLMHSLVPIRSTPHQMYEEYAAQLNKSRPSSPTPRVAQSGYP